MSQIWCGRLGVCRFSIAGFTHTHRSVPSSVRSGSPQTDRKKMVSHNISAKAGFLDPWFWHMA